MNRCIVSRLLDQFLVARMDPVKTLKTKPVIEEPSS
jgi:hypothetical protein